MKRNIPIYKFIAIIMITFLTLSCSEDNPTEPTSDGYWKHYLFESSFDNLITNGKTINDKYYCTTNSGLIEFSDLSISPVYKRLNTAAAGLDNKPVIAEEFAIFPEENSNKSIIFLSYNSESNYNSCFFNFNYFFGEEFDNIYLSNMNPLDEIGTIDNQFKFITTVKAYNSSEFPEDNILYIILNPLGEGLNMIEDYGLIDIPNETGYNSEVKILHYYNYNGKTYLSYILKYNNTPHIMIIDSDNNITDYEDPFGDRIMVYFFFKYRDYLWAYKSNSQLCYSTNGSDWTYFSYLTPSMTGVREINEYLFMYFEDSIYIIGNELKTLTMYSVPIGNMEGATITSIDKFKDDVVVTTTNGIFYKSFSKLISDKEIVRGLY